MNILNRLFFSFIVICLVACVQGCNQEKPKTLSREEHLHLFLPFLEHEQSQILDYQYLYFSKREKYYTIAKVTLSKDLEYSVLEKEYSKITLVRSSPEKELYFDLLFSRAASLVGGTNNFPVWFNPNKASEYYYMDKDTSLSDQEAWYDTSQKIMYLIIVGKGNRKTSESPDGVSH